MHHVLSTNSYRNQKLTSALLGEIERAGIARVEIWCSRLHFDYNSAEDVRELADWFGDHKLELHALHAPTSRDMSARRESATPISISDPERVRRLDAVDEIKRALDVAEQIPFRYLVQHIGSSREAADPRRYDAAFSSLEHLVVFAKERGVTIALENTPGELASPSNLRHFIHDTRLQGLRMCFDTGHAHMEDGIEASFEAMRDLVVTAHIHDNHGEKDEHLLPFEGTIDWSAALKLMATAPVTGGMPLVIELMPAHTRSLEQIMAVFERMENARAAKA